MDINRKNLLLIINNRLRILKIRLCERIKLPLSTKIGSRVLFKNNEGGYISIGHGNEFLTGVVLMSYDGFIEIGEFCSVGPYSILYGHGGLKIGNDVLIAAHCVIVPFNHLFDKEDTSIRMQGIRRKGIIIEDNVWIGAGCRILDGVRIGKGAVIGSGSVVTKDVEPFAIFAGVPAKKIKSRLAPTINGNLNGLK